MTDLASNRERLRDRLNCDGTCGKGGSFAVVLFSCDWPYRDECGVIPRGNINTDKPIRG